LIGQFFEEEKRSHLRFLSKDACRTPAATNHFLRLGCSELPCQTGRAFDHWFVFLFFVQSKENRSTSFEITGAAGFALFGGSKVVCLRNPRSGSRVTSDRAFSLSLSPAARG